MLKRFDYPYEIMLPILLGLAIGVRLRCRQSQENLLCAAGPRFRNGSAALQRGFDELDGTVDIGAFLDGGSQQIHGFGTVPPA